MRIFKHALIIADDFTGANDTAVQFVKFSLTGVTLATGSNITPTLLRELSVKYDVIAINTESRILEPSEAYEIVFNIAERVKEAFNGINDLLLYKKIDSTLRGNITEEIEAIHDSLEPELIVFAPAYPKQMRTTLNGIHMVGGVPVDKTQFGRDPRKPVKKAYIPDYFKETFGNSYRHVYLDELRSGKVPEFVYKFRILSFDIETDSDLRSLVTAVMQVNKNTVWVGSAGLAEHLAYTSIIKSREGKPTLFIIGTLNEVTKNQVYELVNTLKSRLIEINLEALLENSEEEYKRVLNEVTKALNESAEVVITTGFTPAEGLAKKMNITLRDLGSLIAEKLSELVEYVISNIGLESFGGIFMSGGDTASAIIKRFKMHTISIVSEIEPGLPLLKYKDLCLVTKAGGFGGKETLVRVATRIKSICGSERL